MLGPFTLLLLVLKRSTTVLYQAHEDQVWLSATLSPSIVGSMASSESTSTMAEPIPAASTMAKLTSGKGPPYLVAPDGAWYSWEGNFAHVWDSETVRIVPRLRVTSNR